MDSSTAASVADERPPQSRWYRNPRVLLAVVAVAVVVIDLIAKTLAVTELEYGERVHVLGPFSLILIRNPGAAFSMATGMTWVLTLVALAVVVWIIRMGARLTSIPWAIGLGLVLGGAIGNLGDRIFRSPGIFRGHVVDFFSVGDWFAVFNTADSAITCAAVLLVALTLFGKDPYEGFGQKKSDRTTPEQPGGQETGEARSNSSTEEARDA